MILNIFIPDTCKSGYSEFLPENTIFTATGNFTGTEQFSAMAFLHILFWVSVFLIFYNYAGYVLLIALINALKPKKETTHKADADLQGVSFIVAAYNEEECIQQKIENSLRQIYPSGKIEFIFIADGSTDGTVPILEKTPGIRTLFRPERMGKSAALNRAVASAQNEILIFSDANTILNQEATLLIAEHFLDPAVGGVAGEKKVIAVEEGHDSVGAREGLYWKYESFLKKTDAAFYSVVGAAGELFAVRKSLYHPIAVNTILDDFVISLKVAQQGFKVVYEPLAYASELPSFSLEDEKKRKIRIAAGGFQAMWNLRSLIKFWNHPRLTFLYLSHRVMRWAVTPFCLITAFISNAAIITIHSSSLYYSTFILQLIFYCLAFAGQYLNKPVAFIKIARLANYFVFMNISVIRGFFRYVNGRQSATWEKSKRIQSV